MRPDATTRVVVFIRHGHSEWKLSNRFTGWTDVPLTEVGMAEADTAGRRLAERGHAFDEAHVSLLRRTRQTVDALLAAAAHPAIPIHETWPTVSSKSAVSSWSIGGVPVACSTDI